MLFFSEFIWIIVIVFFILKVMVKKVPKNTVYIVDKHTHYHKTVKNGYFFLNPISHTITTKISTTPITVNYRDFFETEDDVNIYVNFSVTYSAKNMEDVLYNLEKVRRSIDDILKSCMYGAMLALNSRILSREVLLNEFRSNLESQAMSFGLDIHNFNIYQFGVSAQLATIKPFKPNKNYSDGEDPIKYV